MVDDRFRLPLRRPLPVPNIRRYRASVVAAFIFLSFFAAPAGHSDAQKKKNILILSEVGLSHSMTAMITQEIVDGLGAASRHVEVYTESLDLLSFPNTPSQSDIREWLTKKYSRDRVDVVVAIGPNVIAFLDEYRDSLFAGVPIVISGGSQDQAGNPQLDARFTGTWQVRHPAETVELALEILPETRHLLVVSGNSAFDKFIASSTQAELAHFESRLEIKYLTDLSMSRLLHEIGTLPDRSAVLYLSYFQDAEGNKFVNATKALPMISSASDAPLFGLSDTYLGHGIVGGEVMSFQAQGKLTSQIVAKLLDGVKPQDIPIRALPNQAMFDWKELQRWGIAESRVPKGSIILFREPGLWERTKWIWITSLLIILGLSAVVAYLNYSREQLRLARQRQRQLSGMLINAGEQERRRVANELHDDFSQRLAVMALNLEDAAESLSVSSPGGAKKLRELVNTASELGADLHSLSHRLHSSTLESLGLSPAVSALCKEFSTQESVATNFSCDNLPRSINPDVALCSFRIVQESLRNIKKHSGASSANVTLRNVGGRLIVTVHDNGRGFDPRKTPNGEGVGLRAMRERALFLGGKFIVTSAAGSGTTVEANIPLNPPVAHEAHVGF